MGVLEVSYRDAVMQRTSSLTPRFIHIFTHTHTRAQVASFFCWGTTHFCTDCHTRQMKGDYVSRLKPSQLMQCRGSKTCPLRVSHPPNGTRTPFPLGCSLCRKNAEF